MLEHLQLNRIGSASTRSTVQRQQVREVREVAAADIGSLRDLVIRVAEEHGETPGSLAAMQEVNAYHAGLPPGQVAFNIQGYNVFYSDFYATVFTHPALKVGSRYFKLEEVLIR